LSSKSYFKFGKISVDEPLLRNPHINQECLYVSSEVFFVQSLMGLSLYLTTKRGKRTAREIYKIFKLIGSLS